MPGLTKTLEYRRARFFSPGQLEQNLEGLVRNAWRRLRTQNERTITSSDNRSTCGLSSRDVEGGGLAIHCACYTAGQSIGTILTARPSREVNVGELLPAPGENFLNSDMMALIRGNHVICMNCKRNAGSLRIYLQKLFEQAEFPDPSRQFEIIRIGSPDSLRLLRTVGVKSIDLKVGIEEALADSLNENGGGGIWNAIKNEFGGALRAITDCDESVGQLRNSEHGTMRVSFNVPKKDIEVVRNGFDRFAEGVFEDENENAAFVIHLRNGVIINPDTISVKKQVKLRPVANSVNVQDVWNEMINYMNELESSGQLEV